MRRIPTRARLALLALLAAVALLLMGAGAANYDWIVSKKLTVLTGGLDVAGQSTLSDVTTGSLIASETVTVTAGGLVVSDGGLTLSDDDLAVADDLRIAPQTGITLTMNGWLTPTGSLTLIQSAGAVSIDGGAKIADGTAGDILILLNVGGQTITISETTGLVSAGNIALGTLDSATFVWRGSTWYEIAASNN